MITHLEKNTGGCSVPRRSLSLGEEGLDPILRLANFYSAPQHAGFGPRYIQEFQLLYFREGKARVTLDNRSFETLPGQIVFYGPGQLHQVTGITNFSVLGFVFLFLREDGQKLDSNSPHSSLHPFTYPHGPPRCPLSPPPPSRVGPAGTKNLAGLALATVESFVEGNSLTSQGNFLLFLDAWLRSVHFASRNHDLTPAQRQLVEAALAYMKANPAADLSSRAIAQQAGLSPRHFDRLFHLYTGQPPRAYVEVLRLEEAKRRLLTSSLTIQSIAASVGYGDSFYFSRRFHAYFGISPSALRELKREI